MARLIGFLIYSVFLHRSAECRGAAFNLMTELATDCRPNVAVVVRLLLEQHSTSSPCQAAPRLPPATTIGAAGIDAKISGKSDARSSSCSPRRFNDTSGVTSDAPCVGFGSPDASTMERGFHEREGAAVAGDGGAGVTSMVNLIDRSTDRIPWQYAPQQIDKVSDLSLIFFAWVTKR